MVLVSNEWQSSKDDEQKPNPGGAAGAAITTLSTTPATVAALAAALNNGITSVTSTNIDQEITEKTAAPITSGAKLSKRSQRNRKVHSIMELSKKSQQEPLQQQQLSEQLQQQQLQMREKHETETNEVPTEINTNINLNNININKSDANEYLEYQEKNNMNTTDTYDSSNSNTLHVQLGTKQATQLQMAVNSVISASNATIGGSLFSSIGALQLPTEAESQIINSNNTEDMSPGEAKIVLHCEPKSHKFETRTILLSPGQECKVGRLIAKSKSSENNAIFDCKVLSRTHAMLWYDGRFWVRDTKSSNGTFINDNKLGNEPAELHNGDTVKFGVEVIENSRQEVHGCIIARVALYLPDGREAISIESKQFQLTGPNRITYDEIMRLNAFLQEASQREKILKAKLSSLQGVLDATRKNSAMCWQSMITEDQLLHKINLLEKKLQMMEKNVPENTLRNEVVKLLEDKSSYQLTAKEALRKVYQDRCDAMQMLSKMEMAYTTSENECSILRGQVASSKQTLQEFCLRLEQLQQEYTDYKEEIQQQQQEARKLEELRLGQQKEELIAHENEMEQMRQQLMQLQQTIAEHDSDHALQQQQTLEHLNAAIGDDFGYDDEDDDDDDDDVNDDDDVDHEGDHEGDGESKEAGDHDAAKKDGLQLSNAPNFGKKEPSKHKSFKKTKRQQLEELDLKNKVIRKGTMLKLLKNSDLKGADSGDVLKAIFNAADSGDEKEEPELDSPKKSPIEGTFVEAACDEFIHKSPKHTSLNGIEEKAAESTALLQASNHKLASQDTLVRNEDQVIEDLPEEQAMDMLHEECLFYKNKSFSLTNDINALEKEVKHLKELLLQQQQPLAESRAQSRSSTGNEGEEKPDDLATDENEPLLPAADKEWASDFASWREDVNIMNDTQVEREEELIVYKERLEQSEMSNMELRKEISELRLKQHMLGHDQNLLIRRALPLGCVALAAIIYFLSIRF